ncbi:hypothetical protein PanWU01x14_347760 [Parasponia andersonii]|nr:hypothetical protein PanWU01x14_347760 [Parasponia andersonii]
MGITDSNFGLFFILLSLDIALPNN